MKRVTLFSKATTCALLFQLVCAFSLNAQGIPPIKNNWLYFAEMAIGEGGATCVIPYSTPVGENQQEHHFILEALVYLNDLDFAGNDPLEYYYNLPNGESGMIEINHENLAINNPLLYIGEMTQDFKDKFGEISGIDSCAYLLFEACMPDCEPYVGCGEFSSQLVGTIEGQGFGGYQLGNSLFPLTIFEADENNRAYHYTEYKEICCASGTYVYGSADPCAWLGGTMQITPAPDPYPFNQSPCGGPINPLIADPTNSHHSHSGHTHSPQKTRPGIDVFPNPSSSEITIQYESEQSGTVQFEFMDAQGRKLGNTKTVNYQTGVHQEMIDVLSWAPGVYFVKVSTTTDTQVARFVRATN